MAFQENPAVEAGRLGRSLLKKFRGLDGRLQKIALPDRLRDTGSSRRGRVAVSLLDEVERAVRAMLPLRTEPGSYQDYDKLARDYAASIRVLQAAEEDMRQFVDNLLEANTSYSSTGPEKGEVRKALLERYYGKILESAKARLNGSPIPLSAELEALAVDSAAVRLCQWMDQMVVRFAEAVDAALSRLQDYEALGRIQWSVPTAFNAFYFEDEVLLESPEERAFDERPRDKEYYYHHRRAQRARTGVKRAARNRHVIRHCLQLRVVGNATEYRMGQSSETIPRDVRRLLKSVPPWLRGLIRIVEGEIRTGVLVPQCIIVEGRKQRPPDKPDWLEPCRCALVTLCDDVLTGWGAPEKNVEVARQNYMWLYLLAGSLAILAAISMGLGRTAGPMWGYVAPLLGTLGVAAFIEACRERDIARRKVPDIWNLMSAGLSWFVLSSGLMATAVGMAVPNWLLGAFGIILTIGGGYAVGCAVTKHADQKS